MRGTEDEFEFDRMLCMYVCMMCFFFWFLVRGVVDLSCGGTYVCMMVRSYVYVCVCVYTSMQQDTGKEEKASIG